MADVKNVHISKLNNGTAFGELQADEHGLCRCCGQRTAYGLLFIAGNVFVSLCEPCAHRTGAMLVHCTPSHGAYAVERANLN